MSTCQCPSSCLIQGPPARPPAYPRDVSPASRQHTAHRDRLPDLPPVQGMSAQPPANIQHTGTACPRDVSPASHQYIAPRDLPSSYTSRDHPAHCPSRTPDLHGHTTTIWPKGHKPQPANNISPERLGPGILRRIEACIVLGLEDLSGWQMGDHPGPLAFPEGKFDIIDISCF